MCESNYSFPLCSGTKSERDLHLTVCIVCVCLCVWCWDQPFSFSSSVQGILLAPILSSWQHSQRGSVRPCAPRHHRQSESLTKRTSLCTSPSACCMSACLSLVPPWVMHTNPPSSHIPVQNQSIICSPFSFIVLMSPVCLLGLKSADLINFSFFLCTVLMMTLSKARQSSYSHLINLSCTFCPSTDIPRRLKLIVFNRARLMRYLV